MGRRWFMLYFFTVIGFLILVQFTDNTITTIAESIPVPRKYCIIIDAGHGGIDGGATSCTGVLESQVNLEIALRLNDLFCLMGYDTRLIRTTDTSIHTDGNTISEIKISDLKERTRIVNSTENGILISIHQNTFSDRRYRGAQVFYGSNPMGELLAKQVQQLFCTTINAGSKRQVKRSKGVYLMEHIHQPGILVECGFLSNPEEDALLRADDYQKKVCSVIVCGVSTLLTNT